MLWMFIIYARIWKWKNVTWGLCFEQILTDMSLVRKDSLKNNAINKKYSASADGGPHSRVCAVTFKHPPRPIRSHIRSFGTLGQHLKLLPFVRPSAGVGGVPNLFYGGDHHIFVTWGLMPSFWTLGQLLKLPPLDQKFIFLWKYDMSHLHFQEQKLLFLFVTLNLSL
jgi:hypothetical protein